MCGWFYQICFLIASTILRASILDRTGLTDGDKLIAKMHGFVAARVIHNVLVDEVIMAML